MRKRGQKPPWSLPPREERREWIDAQDKEVWYEKKQRKRQPCPQATREAFTRVLKKADIGQMMAVPVASRSADFGLTTGPGLRAQSWLRFLKPKSY